MQDLRWPPAGGDVTAILATDSSAAKGMASRRGAGTVRHIHCPALWLQHAVARRQMKLQKRDGKTLPPDVGTKAGIPAAHVWELLKQWGVERATGRAAAQLAAA